MKVIDPNWIMSPGVKPLTRGLAMDLVDVDFAYPYLARQLSGFDADNDHGVCYVMLLGWRDRRSSMLCVEMQQNTGVYTGSSRNKHNTLRPV